jgi:periplasmic protein TonB
VTTPGPGARRRRPLVPLLLLPLAVGAGCADADPVTEQPVLLHDDSPFRYPDPMWDAGIEGETIVMVRVTDTGRVDSVYVLESSGHAALDSAALHGARDLRFSPGRKQDRRVAMWARLPVRFHMGDPAPSAGAMP